MRIIRVNERQIRCMLTTQELTQRSLDIGKLRYGGHETTELFREVLNTAVTQYGFNQDELPLMIEAIPTNEGLLVIISAVEEAEELDAHFANFSSYEPDEGVNDRARTQETFLDAANINHTINNALVSFSSIDEAADFSKHIALVFPGDSELYFDKERHIYYLALIRTDNISTEAFIQFLNTVSEYGDLVEGSSFLYAFLKEHDKPVMTDPLTKLMLL